MEKHVELGELLDIYGALLTDRQRSALSQSVNEDYSLAEIAEGEGISRQGVRDAILRAETQLYALEAQLGLLRLRQGLRSLRAQAETADKAALIKQLDALMESVGAVGGGYGV